jgi:hypothetical protein
MKQRIIIATQERRDNVKWTNCFSYSTT